MNPRKIVNRLAMISAGLFAVAAPTYGHWGAQSAWTHVGETNDCKHGSSTQTTYRKVRIQTFDSGFMNCVEVLGCFWVSFGHDSTATNITPSGNPTKTNSARADVSFFGFDDNRPPGSFLPYYVQINDLARNASVSLASSQGHTFSNPETACVTSDQML